MSLASPVQAWAGMVIVERDVFLSERFRLKHEPIIWKEHGKLQNREYRLLTTLKFIDIDILKSEVEQIVGVLLLWRETAGWSNVLLPFFA